MSTRDARRLGVVHAAADGRISDREGAVAVGLSVRQFRRLRSQVRAYGPSGVVHSNRGRPSPRRLSAAVRDRVVALLTGEVKLNDHHLAELLAEDVEEPVVVSPASGRRIQRMPESRAEASPSARRAPLADCSSSTRAPGPLRPRITSGPARPDHASQRRPSRIAPEAAADADATQDTPQEGGHRYAHQYP